MDKYMGKIWGLIKMLVEEKITTIEMEPLLQQIIQEEVREQISLEYPELMMGDDNDQDRSWCIYAHVLQDGRVYVGQTNNIHNRWKPSAYKNCVKFYNAIQKYGWDNFYHIILEENLTISEANKLEEYYIQKFDSINNGFNLNSGGENKLHSQETKDKMSKTRKGVPHTKEHSQAISESLKGKKKSPEAIRNNQLAQHRKPVICVETEIEYESLSDAQRKTGILGETISRCCRGKQKTAGGFHWRFINE